MLNPSITFHCKQKFTNHLQEIIMAEIKIEKKANYWPWVLAGIVILALLYYFLFSKPNVENNVVPDRDTVSVMNRNDSDNLAVVAFTTYIDNDTGSMSLDHEYSNTALLKLCDATQEVADKAGYEVKAEIDEAREYANKITNDPTVTTHADNIKKSTGIISSALKNIQENSFPELGNEADNVTAASQEISTADLTLDQKGVVKSFFRSASVLLKKMN